MGRPCWESVFQHILARGSCVCGMSVLHAGQAPRVLGCAEDSGGLSFRGNGRPWGNSRGESPQQGQAGSAIVTTGQLPNGSHPRSTGESLQSWIPASWLVGDGMFCSGLRDRAGEDHTFSQCLLPGHPLSLMESMTGRKQSPACQPFLPWAAVEEPPHCRTTGHPSPGPRDLCDWPPAESSQGLLLQT